MNKYSIDNYKLHYIVKGKNVYYLSLGKVGTSTIKYRLGLDVILINPEKSAEVYSKILKNKNNIVIACAREPVSRFVSQYLEITKPRRETQAITKQKKFYKLLLDNEYEKSIISFIELLENKDLYDPHLFSMNTLITKFYNCSVDSFLDRIDFMMTTKTIDDDIEEFCKIYNIKHTQSQIKNKGRDNIKQIITNIVKNNENILSRILKLYEDDQKFYNKVLARRRINNNIL